VVHGSYLHYLVGGDFLQVEFGRDDYYGGLGTGHLWFIIFLFVFSLAALPIWRGRNRPGSRLVGLSRFLAHPAGWLATAIALVAVEALPDLSGKNPFYYFAFFVLGYLALCSPEFMEEARRWAWLTLPLGVAGDVWWIAAADWRYTLADPSVGLTGVMAAGMTIRWLLILGLLGWGSRLLDRPSKTLEYLAEGSYAIYILHQTVIVILAFYLVGVDVPWTAQWWLLLAASVVVTFLVYEGLRRVGWLRFLFGMRPRRKPVVADPRPASGADAGLG